MRRSARWLIGVIASALMASSSTVIAAQAQPVDRCGIVGLHDKAAGDSACKSPTAWPYWVVEKQLDRKVWYQNFLTPPVLPKGSTVALEIRPYAHVYVEVARWDFNDVPLITVSVVCMVERWDPQTSPECASLTPGDVVWITEAQARVVASNALVDALIASAGAQGNSISRYALRVFVPTR